MGQGDELLRSRCMSNEGSSLGERRKEEERGTGTRRTRGWLSPAASPGVVDVAERWILHPVFGRGETIFIT